MFQQLKMKSQNRLLLSIFLIVALSCENNTNQKLPSPRNYQCSHTACSLVIDGSLNEKAWQQVEWSDSFIDIEGASQPKPRFQTQMKMLWNDDFLYIAALLNELHIWGTLSNRDDIIYRDNDFEVFIDPDGDGLNYYEFEINALGTEFDLFMNQPYNKGGSANITWDFDGIQSAVSRKGTLNNPNDIDTSWTVEIAIPWEALSEDDRIKPDVGDIWRMNFSRVQWELEIENNNYKKKIDDTGKYLPENNWVWSPQGVVNMHIPEHWGYVEFMAPDSDVKLSRVKTPRFWVWTSEHKMRSAAYWDSTFSLLNEIGIEGVLMGAGPDILSAAIPVANNYDIEIHAWFWTMNRGDADTSWLSVNRLGKSLAEEKAYVNYYKFMCPALPAVRNFLELKINELIAVKGLGGIHMDYIRYVDAILPVALQPKYGLVQNRVFPEFDYGYHPYMRKKFKEKTGIDPIEMVEPEQNREWLDFRLAVLDTTVWNIRDQVRCEKLQISSAVFPSPEMSRKMVRQGWDNWELDYYFPMVYHNFYGESFEWIENIITTDKAILGENSRVFCGLYIPALKKNDDLTKAMEAAMKGGADGIAFFDLRAIGEAQQQQIKSFIENQKN